MLTLLTLLTCAKAWIVLCHVVRLGQSLYTAFVAHWTWLYREFTHNTDLTTLLSWSEADELLHFWVVIHRCLADELRAFFRLVSHRSLDARLILVLLRKVLFLLIRFNAKVFSLLHYLLWLVLKSISCVWPLCCEGSFTSHLEEAVSLITTDSILDFFNRINCSIDFLYLLSFFNLNYVAALIGLLVKGWS